MPSRRCTADCQDGSPCRAWAVHGTEPPRCSAHGGERPSISVASIEPTTSHDCHIDAVIEDLYRKQMLLSHTIDQLQEAQGIPLKDAARLLRIHGQNAGRLGRLLRDRRALSGDAADGISDAIAQALDELGSELGVEL